MSIKGVYDLIRNPSVRMFHSRINRGMKIPQPELRTKKRLLINQPATPPQTISGTQKGGSNIRPMKVDVWPAGGKIKIRKMFSITAASIAR
jgi:hypothetical protein